MKEDLAPSIAAAAAAAVKELGIEGRFADLERIRLIKLGNEWLEVERKRPPFEVLHVEKQNPVAVAGLEFDGRIDRMDRLEKGHALIDYKTSRMQSPKQWEPPRPDDPQIPLYAVSVKEEIAAVAFAKVRRGDMKLIGFSRDAKALPNVKQYHEWEKLLGGWRAEAEALGRSFGAGEARVDPKRGLQTCRYCDLQTVCRVFEKINPLKEDDVADGEGTVS